MKATKKTLDPSAILSLPLTPGEAHVLLRAIARGNANPDTDKSEVAQSSWLANRIVKVLEGVWLEDVRK